MIRQIQSIFGKDDFLKRSVTKSISAIVLVTAILFTAMFSLSVTVNKAHAATFTPRLTAPESNNKYYYDSNYNVYQKYGYGLPNCTAYAYGRAYEILGKEPNLSWFSAERWYGDNISKGAYKYGSTPKVGAIACWSYGYGGHVAVVETIDSNGNMTLSNSEWGGRTFYLTTAKTTDSNPGGNSWWTFQGYIYLIDSAEVVIDTTSSYNVGTYKTNASPYLNMRSNAGMGYSVISSINSGVSINVTETKLVDGYNWGKTTYNNKTGWVALEYCKFVSAPVQPTTAAPTTAAPTTAPPTTAAPTTEPPTTEAPTTVPETTAPQPTMPNVRGFGRGDVNCDNRITIQDATIIQKYLADLIVLDDYQLSCADFDGDGKCTIVDVSSLQAYLSSYVETSAIHP